MIDWLVGINVNFKTLARLLSVRKHRKLRYIATSPPPFFLFFRASRRVPTFSSLSCPSGGQSTPPLYSRESSSKGRRPPRTNRRALSMKWARDEVRPFHWSSRVPCVLVFAQVVRSAVLLVSFRLRGRLLDSGGGGERKLFSGPQPGLQLSAPRSRQSELRWARVFRFSRQPALGHLVARCRGERAGQPNAAFQH